MFGREKINDPYNTMGASSPYPEKSKRKPKDDGLVVDGVISGMERIGYVPHKIKVRKNGSVTTVTGKAPGLEVTAVYDESTGRGVVRKKFS